MATPRTRRTFLTGTAAAAGGLLLPAATPPARAAAAGAVKVVVWDERQPAQTQAYDDFLGNRIAAHLRAQPGLSVESVKLDDPGQGLADSVLEDCRVLIWWGHQRQAEITPEAGKRLVARIKAGTLALIALHSAHWSTPFMEAMNERARLDLGRRLRVENFHRVEVREIPPPQRYTLPRYDSRPTPYSTLRKFPDDTGAAELHLPYCCFPAYRGDGKPSQVRALMPGHPIAAGVPRRFELARTEMYDEPFHVPEPDAVIFEERWGPGEWFRAGMFWNIGDGGVFYFRPGHETFPIYHDPNALAILTNAVRWLGSLGPPP